MVRSLPVGSASGRQAAEFCSHSSYQQTSGGSKPDPRLPRLVSSSLSSHGEHAMSSIQLRPVQAMHGTTSRLRSAMTTSLSITDSNSELHSLAQSRGAKCLKKLDKPTRFVGRRCWAHTGLSNPQSGETRIDCSGGKRTTTRAIRRLDAQRHSLAWLNAGVRVCAGLVMRARTGSDLQ